MKAALGRVRRRPQPGSYPDAVPSEDTGTSKDGTGIAFERTGEGPPVILVDGALCYRDSGPSRPLAAQLARHCTVYTYDRRGRGASGDTPPYREEREVEDLEALIERAGGSACVYGISSGAALALEAANRGLAIERLALYEAPFIVDDSRPPASPDYVPRLGRLLTAGRRGGAVRHFLKHVGLPPAFVAVMRFLPVWRKLTAVAPTLAYDHEILGDTQTGRALAPDRWTRVTMPTLAVAGGNSPQWMRNTMRAVADLLPQASYQTLAGQTHMVKATALAPVLTEFFLLSPRAGSGADKPTAPSD